MGMCAFPFLFRWLERFLYLILLSSANRKPAEYQIARYHQSSAVGSELSCKTLIKINLKKKTTFPI